MTIAAVIVAALHRARMSQRELARRCGVTEGMVSQWLRPDANLTLATVARMADALDAEVVIEFRPRGGA